MKLRDKTKKLLILLAAAIFFVLALQIMAFLLYIFVLCTAVYTLSTFLSGKKWRFIIYIVVGIIISIFLFN